MPPAPDTPEDALLEPRARDLLRWRSRRGLLENDLFISRFFERHGPALTTRQARAMELLMDLSDNDLLDLLLRRKEPEPSWAGADVVALLGLMRPGDAHQPTPPAPNSATFQSTF